MTTPSSSGAAAFVPSTSTAIRSKSPDAPSAPSLSSVTPSTTQLPSTSTPGYRPGMELLSGSMRAVTSSSTSGDASASGDDDNLLGHKESLAERARKRMRPEYTLASVLPMPPGFVQKRYATRDATASVAGLASALGSPPVGPRGSLLSGSDGTGPGSAGGDSYGSLSTTTSPAGIGLPSMSAYGSRCV